MIFASVSTHGVTGTWLDEILELGVPLVLFAGLWWWSTRKEKKRSGGAAPGPREGLRGHSPLNGSDVPDLAAGSRAARDRARGRRGGLRRRRARHLAPARVLAQVRGERRLSRRAHRRRPRARVHRRAEHPDAAGAVHRALPAGPDTERSRDESRGTRPLPDQLRRLPWAEGARRRTGRIHPRAASLQPAGPRPAACPRRALLLDQRRRGIDRDARVGGGRRDDRKAEAQRDRAVGDHPLPPGPRGWGVSAVTI